MKILSFLCRKRQIPIKTYFWYVMVSGGLKRGDCKFIGFESFQTFFSTFREGEPNADFINKAIRYTEARFDDYVAIHPEAKGMATTLTMTFVGTTGITLAHVGTVGFTISGKEKSCSRLKIIHWLIR